MANLVGKKLGKLSFLAVGIPPEGVGNRIKYPGPWYRVRCDCGVEKWIPQPGAAGCRSCGCSKYDHLKVGLIEAIRYTPNRDRLDSVKERIYTDL
jgi:hypothetical protein